METILITGGAGFIGSNFIRYFLNKYNKYRIVNLDKLTYAGNLENLSDIKNENYVFLKGDICDAKFLKSIFEGFYITGVINFAAESHVDRSIYNPEQFVKTNVLGTQILLDVSRKYCEKNHPKNFKFLQISTDEVYGSIEDSSTFTENSNLAPSSPYSASKASADLFVRAYYKTYGLNVNITRCSNNYGPYQFPEKLIPLMITNAISNQELPLYGDGLNVRDWIHVYDHCTAIDLVFHNGNPGEIYNIGANNEQKNIDIVKLILRTLEKTENLIKYVKDRPGHDRRYAIDATKIRTELGWKPTISFEEGIKQCINWYSENQEWIKNVKSGEYLEYYNKVYANRL